MSHIYDRYYYQSFNEKSSIKSSSRKGNTNTNTKKKKKRENNYETEEKKNDYNEEEDDLYYNDKTNEGYKTKTKTISIKDLSYNDLINNDLFKDLKNENEELKKKMKEDEKISNNKLIEKIREIENLKANEKSNKTLLNNKDIEISEYKKKLINFEKELNKLKEEQNSIKEENKELKNSLEIQKNQHLKYNNLIKEKEILIQEYEKKLNLIEEIVSNKEKIVTNKEEKEVYNNYINMNENNRQYGIIGLKNEELNCYMSSVIQILKNLHSFKSIFLGRDAKESPIKALQKLFNNLYYSKEKSVSILEFKNEFSKMYKRFEGKQHNDSTFFLIYLLQYLHKSFNQPNSNITSKLSFNDLGLKLSEKDEYEFKIFYTKIRAKNNSFIYDLFYGYQMNKMICTACGYTQVSFQCYNILDLPLIDGEIKLKSLEQCLNCYLITKDQKGIQGFDCKKCYKNILSYSTSIVKLPQILIINLKRVGEKYIYNHEIKIPFTLNTNAIDKLDKINKNYELIGFIKHYGNETNGHNVAYSKNIFDCKWYYFNDSEVKEINGYPSTDKSFLLFYQLIDEQSTPTPTPQ